MRKALYVFVVVLVAAVSWAAYYAISPIFIHIEANEALPGAQKNTSATAPVVSTIGHPASGTARVVQAEGATYVRYENFQTINGPDIYVYLSKDLDAKDFIDLGKVRATEGNINYEIPREVNVADYKYVLTWCKQFGVLFNYADISAT